MFLSYAFEASLRGSVENHSSPQVECQSSSVQVIKSAGPKVSKRIASTTHTEINRWPTCILLPSSNYLIYSSCHRHPITLPQASRTLNLWPTLPGARPAGTLDFGTQPLSRSSLRSRQLLPVTSFNHPLSSVTAHLSTRPILGCPAPDLCTVASET